MLSEENLAEALNAHNAPFAKTLGLKITLATKSRIEGELQVTPERCTIPPTLHGGAIMAMADNLGGVGAFLNMPTGCTTSTIESKTNFLRPIPVGDTARAETLPIKIGRTIQVWETRIYRGDGALAAIVTQTQIVTMPTTKT